MFAPLLAALLASAAWAADSQQQLVWNLSVQGAPVGQRTVTIKYTRGAVGFDRTMESFTEINGSVGPVRVAYRQRMTASAVAREPAAFTSVIDQNGHGMEVQGRWTPATWIVSVNADSRLRTDEYPIGKIDISTADLMDPDTRFPLSQFDTVRVLSAETGEVLSGAVKPLGQSELVVGNETLLVNGFSWDSTQGRSEFYYSSDGFLVRYETQILGVSIDAQLAKPPPGGVDDFPVAVGSPKIEETPL